MASVQEPNWRSKEARLRSARYGVYVFALVLLGLVGLRGESVIEALLVATPLGAVAGIVWLFVYYAD